jgi:hypothetical protein
MIRIAITAANAICLTLSTMWRIAWRNRPRKRTQSDSWP